METGEPLATVRDRVLSANAYLGSAPIVEALAEKANIVITGRSTDTALTMAPLRHEFGWAADDYNLLAAGIVAGHIIECGAQCSGGNCLYDWREIPDLGEVGYPIVEASSDGTFVVTKHPGTGGRVSTQSVAEQSVYEMGVPLRVDHPGRDHRRRFHDDSPGGRWDRPCTGLRDRGPARHPESQGFGGISCRLQGGGHAANYAWPGRVGQGAAR